MADEATERITILLQARDKDLARTIDRSNKLIARMEREANRNMSATARHVESRLSSAGNSVRLFAAGAIGGVLAGALAAISTGLRGTVAGIAAIGDEARRAGLSVAAFQEWRFVADQNRIGFDQLVDGFKELNLRADEMVETGAGPAAEAFARLGFDAAGLAEALKDPSELMLEIIDRMEGMDTAAQIRIADEVFGGSAGERFVELLAQGDEGLRETIQRARDLGIVMDQDVIERAAELDRRFGEVQARVSTLFRTIVVGAADAVFAIADVGESVRTLNDQIDEITQGEIEVRFQTDPDVFRNYQQDLSQLNVSLEDLLQIAYEASRELQAVATAANAAGYGAATEDILGLREALDELIVQYDYGMVSAEDFQDGLADLGIAADDAFARLQAIDGLSLDNAVGAFGRLAAAMGVVQGIASRLSAILNAPEARASRLASMEDRGAVAVAPPTPAPGRPQIRPDDIDFGYSGPATGGGVGGGGGSAARASDYEREAAAIRERVEALNLEAAELAAVAVAGRDMEMALDLARKTAELLHAAQKDGREITPELRAEIDALALSYVTAGQNAEEAADRLDRIAESADRGADRLTDLFFDAAQGADAAKRALIAYLLQLAKVQTLQGVVGLGQNVPIIGQALQLLGGLEIPAYASGTNYHPGGAAMINEAGGEIVNLPTGAQVIPHDVSMAMAKSGGGQTINMPVTIDARGADASVLPALQRSIDQLRADIPQIIRAAKAQPYMPRTVQSL